MTSVWNADHVAMLNSAPLPAAPMITAPEANPIFPGIDLWDMWPVQHRDTGQPLRVNDGIVWMALSAPDQGDPGLRHFTARIRLVHQSGGKWYDLGPVLPDGLAQGNREWAGSAIVGHNGRVTLFYTAAGGSSPKGYQQRLFQASADLVVEQGHPRLLNWGDTHESVAADGHHYVVASQQDGEPGKIKAFRDPGFFHDPVTGKNYLAFVGSLAASTHDYNGCVGVALAQDEELTEWELLPPLVSADGLNNELERPHLLYVSGRYYLFWSTQTGVFAPDGPVGPTGLYGMTSTQMEGQWEPLNGSGLVVANPADHPGQAYSWHVLGDLSVTSFVDLWGCGQNAPTAPDAMRAHFGGTPAPFLYLKVDGARAKVSPTPWPDQVRLT